MAKRITVTVPTPLPPPEPGSVWVSYEDPEKWANGGEAAMLRFCEARGAEPGTVSVSYFPGDDITYVHFVWTVAD